MTAEAQENALAAQAQAGGEADAQAHADHAEAMHATIAGSQVDVSDSSSSVESSAVAWTGGDRHGPAGPSQQP